MLSMRSFKRIWIKPLMRSTYDSQLSWSHYYKKTLELYMPFRCSRWIEGVTTERKVWQGMWVVPFGGHKIKVRDRLKRSSLKVYPFKKHEFNLWFATSWNHMKKHIDKNRVFGKFISNVFNTIGALSLHYLQHVFSSGRSLNIKAWDLHILWMLNGEETIMRWQ